MWRMSIFVSREDNKISLFLTDQQSLTYSSSSLCFYFSPLFLWYSFPLTFHPSFHPAACCQVLNTLFLHLSEDFPVSASPLLDDVKAILSPTAGGGSCVRTLKTHFSLPQRVISIHSAKFRLCQHFSRLICHALLRLDRSQKHKHFTLKFRDIFLWPDFLPRILL